jgi:hypothetical protein
MHVADDISVTKSVLSIMSENSIIFFITKAENDINEGKRYMRDRINTVKLFKKK